MRAGAASSRRVSHWMRKAEELGVVLKPVKKIEQEKGEAGRGGAGGAAPAAACIPCSLRVACHLGAAEAWGRGEPSADACSPPHPPPLPPPARPAASDPTWQESLTKLRIFQLEEYARVVYADADGLVWRNMDHLFQLPPARVAMPRAYWLKLGEYSDQIAGGRWGARAGAAAVRAGAAAWCGAQSGCCLVRESFCLVLH